MSLKYLLFPWIRNSISRVNFEETLVNGRVGCKFSFFAKLPAWSRRNRNVWLGRRQDAFDSRLQ
jgi:hypothetical protein